MTTGHLTVDIGDEVVPVTVIRSAHRRRTIAVGVVEDGVRVQAPMTSTDDDLLELLRRRAAWIAERLQAVRSAPGLTALEDGSLIPFRGEMLTLRVESGPDRRAKVTRCGDQLLLRLSGATAGADRSAAIRRILEAWYRVQAGEVLPALVNHWSAIAGLVPTRVLVRDQRRRWGSCGRDGTIRLNWRLILLEPRLVDYVAVHELAHLRHRHHQAVFWEEVARHIPDHRERRREMNTATKALTHFA